LSVDHEKLEKAAFRKVLIINSQQNLSLLSGEGFLFDGKMKFTGDYDS